MKIRIKESVTYSWDEIDVEQTKSQCDKYFDRETFDHESKPLIITDFDIGTNSRGQMVIDFQSKNHKYFEIKPSMIWHSWDDNEIDEDEPCEFGSRSIRMESFTKAILKDDKDINFPLWATEMVITPESEEEVDLLGDRVSVLQLKWQYALTFLKFEDFDIDKKNEDSLDKGEEFKQGEWIYKFKF